MDLGEGCSRSRSEELVDESKIETNPEMNNGDMGHADVDAEHPKISEPVEATSASGIEEEIANRTPAESTGSVNANWDGIAAEHTAQSPSRSIGSSPKASPDEAEESKSTPMKGYGLKKWRRIRRDLSKDAVSGADSAQILKRRLSLAEPVKTRNEGKTKSDADGEASIASNMAVASTAAVVTGVLDPELVHLVASGGFAVGADSDNSEDHSSKSSTATSALKLRHEIGFGRDRSRGKSSGGRGSGHAVQQRGQRGRGGGADASKKFRGDQLRFEKENSQSSIESHQQGSNAALARWSSLVSSNGKQSERSMNDDGEHSDEDQTCEEVHSGYYKENGRVGDSSSEDLDDDPLEEENIQKNETGQPHTDFDPFVESFVLLQAAQEALETEIEKFREISRGPTLYDSNGQPVETEGSSSPALEVHFLELNQKIKHLEYKLEEASATVRAKESKVLELESILNRTQSPKKGTESTDPRLHENHMEMELELEGLFRRKIEAEIEYLITTRANQNLGVLMEDQIVLLGEQRSLVKDQALVMTKLREAENKAIMLKEQAEELEARFKALLQTEEVLKLQTKVCESSLCCFIQLVMLCIAFWWFMVQLLPLSEGVVPT